MKKIIPLIIVIGIGLLSPYVTTGFAQETNFFVMAHQDDWQLFMNPKAYESIKEDINNKTVFIYTTAGDGGLGAEPENEHPYYIARNQAALAAVRFMVNTNRGDYGSYMASENSAINGHAIQRYIYKNTVSYFFNLPNGNSEGTGYPITDYQSLRYFYEGSESVMTAIDDSTTYYGWDDLVDTVEAVIYNEIRDGDSVTFNIPDTDTSINPGDHSGHIYTSILMQAVAARNPCINLNLYRDYATSDLPVNVSTEDLILQAGTWGVTTSGLSDMGQESTWEPHHNSWLGRQYYRSIPGNCSGSGSSIGSLYEAEDGVMSPAFLFDNYYTGYTGDGFVDFVGEGFLEWQINIFEDGDYQLVFRYALKSGDRPLSISIDGQSGGTILSFPATGSFGIWGEVSATVTLSAGVHTLTATTTGSSGANVDSLRVESSDGNMPPPSETLYQAENAEISPAFQVATDVAGYTGTGFVDYIGEGYVKWTVDIPSAGDYQLSFRYGLRSGDRPLSIKIDGQSGGTILYFPATGSWNNWSETGLTVNLAAGTHTIYANTTGSSGANIDSLKVVMQ